MKKIYISTYCIHYEDYNWLKNCIDSFSDFPIGVEFAAGLKNSSVQFREKLEAQIPVFAGVPTTFHSPFVEWCTEAGSPEEASAKEAFTYACSLYPRFNARSMVFHTHEASFPEEKKEAMRGRSLEVLLNMWEQLKTKGIHMTVENVGFPKKNNVLFDEEQFIHLFDELPGEVGCLIDTGHAMLNHWDICKVIRHLGTRIRGYHLNNNDGRSDLHYPTFAADGFYTEKQMCEVVAAIKEYTPEADIILEYAPGERITKNGILEDVRKIATI